MKVEHEGRKYTIEFRYGWVVPMEGGIDTPDSRITLTPSAIYRREFTQCLIRDASEADVGETIHPVIAEGRAVRHYKDLPNREIARKQALAKALASLDIIDLAGMAFSFMKARRGEFWKVYLNRKPQPALAEAVRRVVNSKLKAAINEAPPTQNAGMPSRPPTAETPSKVSPKMPKGRNFL